MKFKAILRRKLETIIFNLEVIHQELDIMEKNTNSSWQESELTAQYKEKANESQKAL